ncbi:MAG: serine/threonine protein kinase, partial [Planctomycetes bacterium]|nr:serine/threonine protein kinase [Planctomycetota bacterium]
MDADATVPMTPPDPGLAAGSQFGPFRIEGRLGSGGMGVVYRAVQGLLERPVALKVMRPELESDADFTARFLREARAAAAVCHQNCVAIHDAGRIDGRLYLAFQFVEGGDLDALLARRGPLPEAEAVAIAAGCCAGLQAIHEAGLVHRDLKPHNVFLDARGRPRLGDFGLARRSAGDDRLTATGAGMGTPAYMAPEQANGVADIDIRADIHALGGTLYTLLTGQPPFSGATAWAVVQEVCTAPAPDPRQLVPGLSEGVAAVALRAMAKRREDRYADPAAMLADLQRLQGGAAGG